MEMRLQLTLPRDATGIPVARRVLRTALLSLGLDRGCVDDIEIAMAEACTNVLLHAGVKDAFEVSAVVDGAMCILEVVDRGKGFQPQGAPTVADPESEHGRGLLLMHALMDQLDFDSVPGGGTVARLSKNLSWGDTPGTAEQRAARWAEQTVAAAGATVR